MSYSITTNSAAGTAALVVADGEVSFSRVSAGGTITTFYDRWGNTLMVSIEDVHSPRVTRKAVVKAITNPQEWTQEWVDSLFGKIEQMRN